MRLTASVISVGVGGMVGVAARVLLDAAVGEWWSLLLINAVGSFALGIVVTALGAARPWIRHGLGAGVLGGFTSFSAVAVASVSATATAGGLGAFAPALPGVAIAAGHFVACVASAWAGFAVGQSAFLSPGAKGGAT